MNEIDSSLLLAAGVLEQPKRSSRHRRRHVTKAVRRMINIKERRKDRKMCHTMTRDNTIWWAFAFAT